MKGEIEWHPLHPLSPFLRAVRIVTIAVVVAMQQLQQVFDQPLIALIVFIVGSTGAGLYGWVSYHWTGFRVTREQIELKTGLLFRQHRRIPLDRIEAIDVARPIVARVFGLVELRCEVASGSGSEMKFQYLGQHDAEALRDYLLQLRSQPQVSQYQNLFSGERSKNPYQGDLSANVLPEGQVVLEIPAMEILVAYGVVRITAVTLSAAIPLVIGLFVDVPIATGVFIGALPVVLAIGLTTIKVVENFWGFRVMHDQRGLSVRRGLLNELTQKVPIARIQALRIEEPLLWRMFDRARLTVDVAGYRNVKIEGSAETAVLAPVASKTAIRQLLNELIGTIDIDSLPTQPAPRRAIWRAPIAFRFLNIAGDNKWAISSSGFFRRRTDIVAHQKAQSIHVSQGPWQRRLGLGTLEIETAGNRIRFRAAHRDFHEANHLAWLSRDLAEAPQ